MGLLKDVEVHGKRYLVLSENSCQTNAMREFNPQFNATIEFNLYLSYLKVQFKQYLSENIFRDITPNTTLRYQKIHSKYYLMLSENSSNQQ